MALDTIETPYGNVQTFYRENEDICTSFELYRPKNQTKPLTLTEISEIIETIYSYYDYTYDDFWYIPKNFHLETPPFFQAKRIQQKYNRKD